MPRKTINWGTDEEFIAKYEELKSSRKMANFIIVIKVQFLIMLKKLVIIQNQTNNINYQRKIKKIL